MLLQDAWDLAQAYLDSTVRSQHSQEIAVSAVIDHPRAWAFAYNSRAFLTGEDFLSSLVGNGPVVVTKDGRPPFLAESSTPVVEQLDQLSE